MKISSFLCVFKKVIKWWCFFFTLVTRFFTFFALIYTSVKLTDVIAIFLDYGTTLVFGASASDHFLAFRVINSFHCLIWFLFSEYYRFQFFFFFKALPIALFFGGVVNVLYYWGAIQYIILKFSWLMNKMMDTSSKHY